MRWFTLAGFAGIALLTLFGCNTLPPGNPPEGNIVQPENFSRSFSSRGASNQLITSLTTFCLQEVPPNSTISAKFSASKSEFNLYPQKVLRNVAKVARLRSAADNADYNLSSNIVGSEMLEWEMVLTRRSDNKQIWNERVYVDQKRPE